MNSGFMTVRGLQRYVQQHAVMAITTERSYILPHPMLRKYISHYTLFTPIKSQPECITVIPDASVSLVCCLGKSALEMRLWGPSSRTSIVENNVEKIPLYCMVEFFPAGAHAILHLPLSHIHNKKNSFSEIDINLSRNIAEKFEKYVVHTQARGVDDFLTSLDHVFLQRLERAKPSPLVQHAIHELRRDNGTTRIADMARQAGYSARHLNRLASETIGMSIKLLARIVRINAACRCMASPFVSLTHIAHALHYHDQAHFVHDFKGICGVPPGEYLQNMSHFYNEEVKFGDMFPKK